ncbi:MAG: GGDEF domain-containing protein [Oceanospirillales bacterium]|nr:MAG: GGDEF domain-containing protein [Oceanospirillales bacterium]
MIFTGCSGSSFRKYVQRIAIVFALLFVGFSPVALANSPTPYKVILQLPWHHQFQFAGYYAAQQQGFYQEAGLDVEIRSGFFNNNQLANSAEEVVFQRAHFGVARSELLIHHARGLPVVVLANIVQRSPTVFITLEEYGFERLEDIGDRPISLTLPDATYGNLLSAETLGALKAAGLNINSLNNHSPTWKLEDLIEGNTQLMPGWATDEPYMLERMGHRPVTISPLDYGIDLYGDLLFTHQQLLIENPSKVEAFRAASLRGWRYALDNPDSVIEYIVENLQTPGPLYDADFFIYEAQQLRQFMQPELIEIGYINPDRWQAIADLMEELEMIQQVSLDGFLYQPSTSSDEWQKLWNWLVIALLMLLTTFALIGWLHRSNRKLVLEIRKKEHTEKELIELATLDPLTGLMNRLSFNEILQQSVKQARQLQQPLCVMMLDADNFKQINDTYGHLAGDVVLKNIATLVRTLIRTDDIACRFGGEEFAFILTNTRLNTAHLIAQRIVNEIADTINQVNDIEILCTVSIGLAELNSSDKDGISLLNRADTYLYKAKDLGRNQIAT